jgi:hypothetical protein
VASFNIGYMCTKDPLSPYWPERSQTVRLASTSPAPANAPIPAISVPASSPESEPPERSMWWTSQIPR